MTSQVRPTGQARAAAPPWRAAAVVTLLAAVSVGWAALPARPGALARLTLIAAIVTAAGGTAQLFALHAADTDAPLATAFEQTGLQLARLLRGAPWAELATVCVAGLEAEHAARPWHTGVLALALVSYLFAVHLAETTAPARVLRPQLPLLLAGAGLVVVAVAAAALPAPATSPVTTTFRVLAAVAAVIAAGLATPVWLGHDGTDRGPR